MKSGPLKVEFKGFLSFLILHELDMKGLSGEDLAIKIGERKGTQLTPGTIYPTLKKLRKLKLVRYKRFGRRKVYNLTDEGKKELERLYVDIGKYLHGLDKVFKKKQKKKRKKKAKKTIKKKKPAKRRKKSASKEQQKTLGYA